MASQFRVGIQSYSFRKFRTIDELIVALKKVELSYVEIWPRHIPFEQLEASTKEALAKLKDNGITMDSYGVVDFENDEAAVRKILDFARLTGLKALSCDIDPDAYGLMDRLLEEYDIRLAIHNHGRKHRYGTFEALEEAFAKTSPRIGLCLDSAWFLDAGYDPVEAVDRLAKRLCGVHLKDFAFDADGKHRDVILGTGGLPLPKFMKRLAKHGFDGFLSIEYEGEPEDPVPQVLGCVRAVRKIIGN